MDIPNDIIISILKYIQLKTLLLCMKKVCRKWNEIITNDNFMIEAVNDNYHVQCNKLNIYKTINWLVCDKIRHDLYKLYELDNGNIFYGAYDGSYVLNNNGNILFQSDQGTKCFDEKIIKYEKDNNEVSLFDSSGNFIEKEHLNELKHIYTGQNILPLYISNKGNIILESNVCEENYQYLKLNDGYIIDNWQEHELIIHDSKHNDIIIKYENIAILSKYGFIFIEEGMDNWILYNYRSRRSEKIYCRSLSCSKNKFIIQYKEKFILYEMKNNDYYKIYEYVCERNFPKKINGWKNYHKTTLLPYNRYIKDMTVDERNNYVYILYYNGDIFKINVGKKNIEFLMRIEMDIIQFIILQTGKLLISYKNDLDDKTFRIINL